MSELTKEQLQQLTDEITDRLKEFEMPNAMIPTKGTIRVAYEVISAYLRGQMTPAPRGFPEEAADKRHFAELERKKEIKITNGVAPSVAATLGPEHTVVTPLKNGTPRTLAEAQGDELTELTGSELKAALLRQMIGELQMLSKHGEMPTQAEWDEHKPLHLPKAQAATQRFNLTWGRLAEYAHLRYEGRRPTPSPEVAGTR